MQATLETKFIPVVSGIQRSEIYAYGNNVKSPTATTVGFSLNSSAAAFPIDDAETFSRDPKAASGAGMLPEKS